MLQRAFYELRSSLGQRVVEADDAAAVGHFTSSAGDGPATPLVNGLFGPQRRLYKRLGEFSFFQDREVYDRVARRPYPWLVACAANCARTVNEAHGTSLRATDVLFDAPPVEKEVEFNIEVYFQKENVYRRLEDVSPVVRALATEQFDDYVKRVRIYGNPDVVDTIRRIGDLRSLVLQAAERTPLLNATTNN